MHNHFARGALIAALLTTITSAQSTIISPVTAATGAGAGGNTIPWNSTPWRYMQIHSDMGGAPLVIKKLAFRQAGSTVNYTGTRAIDLELYMGNTVDYGVANLTYASNFTTPRLNVIARKIVNFGPQGQATNPGPNPFVGMDLLLDIPFVYTGTQSLGWDVSIYSNTLTGANWNSANLDQSTSSSSTAGALTGTGCGALSHTVSIAVNGGILSAGFALTGAAASQPTLLAIGASNLNAPVPGLCSNVYTDLALVLPVGSTNTSGGIPLGGSASFNLGPNGVPGVTLYSQMHTVNPASAFPIPVDNSNGRSFLVPVNSLTKVVKATRLYASSATATQASWATVGVVGYALVTEFTY